MGFTKTLLDPKKRSLKSHQVGLSNHKNVYSNGTLENNWNEERRSYETYEREKSANAKFNSQTITQTSFLNPTEYFGGNAVPRRNMKVVSDVDRNILFRHGIKDPKNQFITSNETFFSQDPVMNETNTDKILVPSLEPEAKPRSTLMEKKMKQWEAEKSAVRGEQSAYVRTSDSYGKGTEGVKKEKKQSSKWGEMTKRSTMDYHKLGLRNDW